MSKVIIYPNFQGSDYDDTVSGRTKVLRTSDILKGEPSKDFDYLTGEKWDYINNIILSVKEEGISVIPPIKVLEHPLMSDKYIVIDGNHRLGAFEIGGIKEIMAAIISEDDVLLAVPDDVIWKEDKVPKTISLRDAINEKKINLKKYFLTEVSKEYGEEAETQHSNGNNKLAVLSKLIYSLGLHETAVSILKIASSGDPKVGTGKKYANH